MNLSNGQKKPRFVCVDGAARSGTTLFRVMLAGHPSLFVSPEMSLGQYDAMAERKKDLPVRYWEKGGLPRALVHVRNISVEEAKHRVEASTPVSGRDVYHRFAGGALRQGFSLISAYN